MERDGFSCCHCGASKSTLHVHHLMYFKGKAPWDYEPKFLRTLCDNCHKRVEDAKQVAGLMFRSEPALACFELLSEIVTFDEWPKAYDALSDILIQIKKPTKNEPANHSANSGNTQCI